MSETTQTKAKEDAADKTNGKTKELKSETRAKEPAAAAEPLPAPPAEAPPPAEPAPAEAAAPPAPAPAPAARTSRQTGVQLMAKVAQLPEDKQHELEAKTETLKARLEARMQQEFRAGVEEILREGVGESVAPASATVPSAAPAAPAASSARLKVDLSPKNASGAQPRPASTSDDPHDFYAGMLEADEPPPVWTRGAMEVGMTRTATGRAYTPIDVVLNAIRERPGRDPIFFAELQEPALCASVEGKPVHCKKGDEIQLVVFPSLVGLKRIHEYAQEHKGRVRVMIRPLGPSPMLDGDMAFRWRIYPDENETSRPKLYPLPQSAQ